jgi:hypothetical protein
MLPDTNKTEHPGEVCRVQITDKLKKRYECLINRMKTIS